MTRRQMIGSMLASSAGVMFAPMTGMGTAKDPNRLKGFTMYPSQFPIWGEVIEALGESVKELSQGHMAFDMDSMLEKKMSRPPFEALKNGDYDFGIFPANYMSWLDSNMNYFSCMPYGMGENQFRDWIRSPQTVKLYSDYFREQNLVYLPFGWGTTAGFYSKNIIHTIDDFDESKTRFVGFAADVLRGEHHKEDMIPLPQAVQAYKAGKITISETSVIPFDNLFHIPKILPNLYVGNFPRSHNNSGLFVNYERWQAMKPELRESLRRLTMFFHEKFSSKVHELDRNTIVQLKKEGLQIRRIPKDLDEHLQERTESYLKEHAETSEWASQIHKAYFSYQA